MGISDDVKKFIVVKEICSIFVVYIVLMLYVAKSCLNQSDCRAFQTSILKKRLSYIKYVPRHYHVTKHSESQQVDQVSVFGYCQTCPS